MQITQEGTRRGNPLLVTGVVLVAVAALCAVTFGILWLTSDSDPAGGPGSDASYSSLRDNALRAAEQGSINLTTLDYRNVTQGLNRWKDSTTGTLYSQLTAGSLVTTFTKQAQQAKSVTTSKVLDGVITQLDEHAGTANALVYMDVTVTTAGGQPTEKRLPLQWELKLTSTGWKLDCINTCSAPGQ